MEPTSLFVLSFEEEVIVGVLRVHGPILLRKGALDTHGEYVQRWGENSRGSPEFSHLEGGLIPLEAFEGGSRRWRPGKIIIISASENTTFYLLYLPG